MVRTSINPPLETSYLFAPEVSARKTFTLNVILRLSVQDSVNEDRVNGSDKKSYSIFIPLHSNYCTTLSSLRRDEGSTPPRKIF